MLPGSGSELDRGHGHMRRVRSKARGPATESRSSFGVVGLLGQLNGTAQVRDSDKYAKKANKIKQEQFS